MTGYLHGHHESVLASHRWRTAANSAAYLLEHLRSGQNLLDVGAGPGTITADLAQAVHPGRVTVVEISEEVLELSRRACAERGVANVDFRLGDAHDLPFPDETFDVVHFHQVLQHVADPIQVLREAGRVTRSGGLVAARDSDYAAFAWYPESAALDEWLELYHRLARESGGEPDAGRRFRAWARAAGFTDFTVSASTWCFANAADTRWWGGVWTERALESEFATRARAAGVSEETLASISDGWRTWGEHPDAWLLIPHGELLARVQ